MREFPGLVKRSPPSGQDELSPRVHDLADSSLEPADGLGDIPIQIRATSQKEEQDYSPLPGHYFLELLEPGSLDYANCRPLPHHFSNHGDIG